MPDNGEIHDVVLCAADPEGLAAWYARHFGLRQAADGGATAQWGEPTGVSFTSHTGDQQQGRRGWSLTIRIPDPRDTATRLRAADIPVELTDTPDGPVALLADPEGNEVRLRQQPDTPGTVAASDDDGIQLIDADAETEGARARRRLPPAVWIPGALVLAGVIAFVAIVRPGSSTSQPAAPGTETSQPQESTTSSTTQATTVTRHDAPLAGITADWQVVVAGDEKLARVEPATGQITYARVPDVGTEQPVSLVAGPDAVFVSTSSSGSRQNYLWRTGQPVAEARDAFADIRWALPGPEPGQLWVARQPHEFSLLRFDGSAVGPTISVPKTLGTFPRPYSDGAGHLLVRGPDGYYVAASSGLRRLTTGTVLALGPTTALALECDKRARCQSVVIDRTQREHRVLTEIQQPASFTGTIAPDGSAAAMQSGIRPRLIDLHTGEARTVDISFNHQSSEDERLAWSPDSRWLVIADGDRIVAVDTTTGEKHPIPLELTSARSLSTVDAPAS